MRTIKVTFNNGATLTTAINGTEEQILDYYIGREFNLGRAGHDYMVIATKVEFLD